MQVKSRYRDFSTFIKEKFNGRVQKVSIDAGFTCPNKDGTKGKGGCTYCNNNTFNPDYCKPIKPISVQINEGIEFFSKKYKTQKYLAYFQAFTNTYAPLKDLKPMYEEALSHKDVVGLVIATRPDSIKDDVLDYLQYLAKIGNFIKLEFGLESTKNKTLEAINRCQTHEEAVDAFSRAKGRGLHLGAHLILGLPGENKEDMLEHARKVSQLPVNTLKIHHLQIVKHTMMAYQFKNTPEMFTFMALDEYIDLVVDFIELLHPDIILERFFSESPARMLIHPKYGLKNFEVKHLVNKRLEERDAWQGRLYKQVTVA
ncbi:MAG: TIGR01212 family radical SAM protein [Flavobacteriales bacterium]|nr:TIGR01212 family radical SAM protein [Flavobacteriales bacterium]|tara:strand:+ start:6236 stop:7177 length:942 start_codon:yes stop_codon:yes gene_type:complete